MENGIRREEEKWKSKDDGERGGRGNPGAQSRVPGPHGDLLARGFGGLGVGFVFAEAGDPESAVDIVDVD